jgi:thiol-disulfide isomerase/thioredoxin
MTDFEIMINNIMKPIDDEELLPEINVMFFWADWCPYCRKTDMDRIYFQQKYSGQIIGGYKIKCTVYNETINKEQMTKYGVNCFPTILALKDSRLIELDIKQLTTSYWEQYLTASS